MDDLLRIGDTVRWRGAWGQNPPRRVVVVRIERCPEGTKYGEFVIEIPWRDVPDRCVVDLDNGHWAYGDQISRQEEEGT